MEGVLVLVGGVLVRLVGCIAELQQLVSAPDFYAQHQDAIQEKLRDLAETEALLEQRIERWSELETLRNSFR